MLGWLDGGSELVAVQAEWMKVVVGWACVVAFLFTLALALMHLTGIFEFKKRAYGKTLVGLLVFEVAVIGVAMFRGLMGVSSAPAAQKTAQVLKQSDEKVAVQAEKIKALEADRQDLAVVAYHALELNAKQIPRASDLSPTVVAALKQAPDTSAWNRIKVSDVNLLAEHKYNVPDNVVAR